MKRWIPGVIILAGILVTVGVVASKTATSHASDQVSGIGNLEESQSDDQVTEGVAFIGIALAPVSEDKLAETGATSGALITSIVDGGPADGLLQEKDIILAVDGVAVESPRDVVEMVHALLPGAVVTFAVSRDGASLNVEVTASERKAMTLAFGKLATPHLIPHKTPYFNFTSPDGLIKSEVKTETEDGVRTVRTAVGTVSDIDIDTGTFSLVLKDGSETVQYEVDKDTKVTIHQSGELSGLNTKDLTTVIDYRDNEGDWKVKSVVQGGHPEYMGLKHHKQLRGFRGILPGAEYRFFRDRSAGDHGLHGSLSPGSSKEFFENMPDDFIYRFERFHQSTEHIEPGDEVIIEGASPS